MDQTTLFRAVIKAVRARQKLQKENPSLNRGVLSKTRSRTEFSVRSKDVANSITKLRQFLLEHRRDYVNAAGHLTSDKLGMSDCMRDQIDQDTVELIQCCQQRIKTLRCEVEKQKIESKQLQNHRQGVLQLLEVYLQGVCHLYSEQKAIRIHQVVDKKRASRLEPESSRIKMAVPSFEEHIDGHADDDLVDDELSPEERHMFEQENKQMVQAMNSIADEVRQIEGKVVEISRLQEIFSKNVLEQANEIEYIGEMAMATTENVREGNEEIRRAIKNNASWRVWVVFFLLMCSLCLLFLDWYSS